MNFLKAFGISQPRLTAAWQACGELPAAEADTVPQGWAAALDPASSSQMPRAMAEMCVKEKSSSNLATNKKPAPMVGKGCCPEHRESQLYLGVDDEDEGSCAPEDHLVVKGGVEEVDLPGEIPNLKVDEGAVGDVLPADLVGAFQEERLIGRHLVEDDFLNGRLAAPPQAHQQDPGLHLRAERVAEVQNCRNHRIRRRLSTRLWVARLGGQAGLLLLPAEAALPGFTRAWCCGVLLLPGRRAQQEAAWPPTPRSRRQRATPVRLGLQDEKDPGFLELTAVCHPLLAIL